MIQGGEKGWWLKGIYLGGWWFICSTHNIEDSVFFFPCGVQRMECTLPTSIHQPLVTFSRLFDIQRPVFQARIFVPNMDLGGPLSMGDGWEHRSLHPGSRRFFPMFPAVALHVVRLKIPHLHQIFVGISPEEETAPRIQVAFFCSVFWDHHSPIFSPYIRWGDSKKNSNIPKKGVCIPAN